MIRSLAESGFLLRWLGGLRPGREQILEFQGRRLRRLVAHAYANVPLYRELWRAVGMEPGDVRGLEDLASIPAISRSELQDAPPERVLARGTVPDRLVQRTTSGSSGAFLAIRRECAEERLLNALRLRAFHDLGMRAKDRRANIVYLRAPGPFELSLAPRALQRLGLYRSLRVHCLLPPERIAAELVRFRPHVVGGFPGVLDRVAAAIEAGAGIAGTVGSTRTSGHSDTTGIAGTSGIAGLAPRFIVSGGEILSTGARGRIAAAFGAPVRDSYGAHEFNLLATECPEASGYHVCEAGVVLEVLRDGRPAAAGEEGEVVATALHSFAMPFVRYRLGDLAVRGPEGCPCGRPVSTLLSITGRSIDYFPLADGRLVHPYELVAVLLREAGGWLRRYQLTQEREDHVVVRLSWRAEPAAGTLERLERALTEVLGPRVGVEIVPAGEIELEATGKFRVSRSLVSERHRSGPTPVR